MARKAKAQAWFVYLLRCSDGTLYTGIATDVPKRLGVHNSGRGSAYVRSRRPAKLLAFVSSKNRSTASSLEYEVKALSRAQKLALVKKWKIGRKIKAGTPRPRRRAAPLGANQPSAQI